MTRYQRQAATTAISCLGLAALGFAFLLLCSLGGCGGPADVGERAGLVSR